MIQLEALKEQLRLLGHDLPDAQITAILAEMNVEVDTPGMRCLAVNHSAWLDAWCC